MRNSSKMHWEEHHVAVVHIHWNPDNNSFSPPDRDKNLGTGKENRYLVKHDGTVEVIEPNINSEDGYTQPLPLFSVGG